MPYLPDTQLPKVKIGRLSATEPQVWVGCLGCYREDRLVGFWVAASHAPATMNGGTDYDPEDDSNQHFNALVDDFATPMANGHHRRHEELFVADYDNMHALYRDGDGIAGVRRAGDLITALEAVPMQPEVFASWWRDQNPGLNLLAKVDPDDVERILRDGNGGSTYRGQWPTLGSYAEDETGELHSDALAALPEDVRLVIGWQELGETWESNGRITSYAWHDGVYVFENN